jgi:N-dimethylarginine dimethylaminohydrolase
MVFAANGATVIDGRALLARFRFAERKAEAAAYHRWLEAAGYPVVSPTFVNEGEGDLLTVGNRILAGTGFRTDWRAHDQAGRVFDREMVTLTLVDPRFYHLDTALAVLRDDLVMYYPAAFAAPSRARLAKLFPDAIRADEADAEAFGLNAVSDGHTVVLSHTATGLIKQLRDRGFHPIGVDVSELLRAGGGVKCCTLELRERPGRGR